MLAAASGQSPTGAGGSVEPSGSTDENSELQRARAGDLAAFRQLVLRHQTLVLTQAAAKAIEATLLGATSMGEAK